jgi:lipopolysaccharide/colanic/teichoic acid biosynthesis glycosyltransferase
MRIKSPSSRASFRVHLSAFDVLWAAASPFLALYLRDAYILSAKGASIALIYCCLSLICSIIAFLMFRLSNGVSRYFSVHDALNVVKAVLAAWLMSSLVLFTFNRLDGIPRSTPVLQVLIMAAGLLTARMFMLLWDDSDPLTEAPSHSPVENIIMIGSTRLSALYIRFLRSCSPDHFRFIAILDHANKFIGRAICGVPVVALPQHLEPMIEEFAVHGVPTDRVIVGGDENLLSHGEIDEVRKICARRQIALDFVPKLIGLDHLHATRNSAPPAFMQSEHAPAVLPAYYQTKRLIDFFAALLAIILLSPLFLLAILLVLVDLGSPVLFWQQRIGQNGKSFLLYKFRTLRPPFNRRGEPIPQNQRTSPIGFFLRKIRIDELPQLFSVLVGDMSLIGPRPLLPHDQPTDATRRLSVRPGITGWAQVKGGNLVTRDEKGALDEWYIHHMSLWLDLRVAVLTLRWLLTGEHRSEKALHEALSVQQQANRYSDWPSQRKSDIRRITSREVQTAAALGVNTVPGISPTRSRTAN